jgi:YfiH family protein
LLNPIEARSLASPAGIRHGFFDRRGGVSEGIYASLNCGLGSKDVREHVVENRRRVGAHLGSSRGAVVTVYQVHSATALVIDQPFPAGAVPQADALVTRTRGLVIGALAADCTPVLFADPEAGIVAAAHAGWRGALGGVLEATVAAMQSIGASRQHIRAAIGPCIGPAAYEVGPAFAADFTAADPDNARFFHCPTPGAREHFDLPGFVNARLERLGLGAVEQATACTYADPDRFFSYRRTTHRKEADYGRQISAIVVT